MNQEQYLQECLKTWRTDLSFKERISNAALGIMGEIGEVINDTNSLEIGDVFYYITMLLNELGYRVDAPIGESIGLDFNRLRILTAGANLCELVKKDTFHGKNRSSEILKTCHRILVSLATYFGNGMTWDQIRRLNIEKLRSRYPDSDISESRPTYISAEEVNRLKAELKKSLIHGDIARLNEKVRSLQEDNLKLAEDILRLGRTVLKMDRQYNDLEERFLNKVNKDTKYEEE